MSNNKLTYQSRVMKSAHDHYKSCKRFSSNITFSSCLSIAHKSVKIRMESESLKEELGEKGFSEFMKKKKLEIKQRNGNRINN